MADRKSGFKEATPAKAGAGKPRRVLAKGSRRGRPEPLTILRRRKVAMYVSVAVAVIFVITLFLGFGVVPTR